MNRSVWMYVCMCMIHYWFRYREKKTYSLILFYLHFLCYEKMCLSIYVYIPDIFLKTVPSASPCVHIDSQIVVFKRVYTEWSVFIKLSISYCQIPFFLFFSCLFSILNSFLIHIWYPFDILAYFSYFFSSAYIQNRVKK